MDTDPESVFRTEVLCQWVTVVDSAINPAVWESLADPDAPRGDAVTFALDVAPDNSSATIAVAWKRSDGSIQVQLVEHRPEVDWAVDRVIQLVKEWHGQLVLEATGTAAFLLPTLEAARIKLETVQRRFYVDGCSALDTAVTARQIRHGNQPELNTAVTHARWKTSGETGQRFISRKDPRVSPLVAAILASNGLSHAFKNKPGRLVFLS